MESLRVKLCGFLLLRIDNTVQMISGIPPQMATSFLTVVSSRLWSRSLNKEDESSSLKACNSINSMGKKMLKSLASVDVRIRLTFSVCPISFMKVKKSSFLDLTLILEHLEQYSSPRGPGGSRSRFFSRCNKLSRFSMIKTTRSAFKDLIRSKACRIFRRGPRPRLQ